MPTTTEQKIAGINKSPCTPGDTKQTITNITNVLNELNGNGSVIARCTLTSDGLTCAPTTLAVSGFNPLVSDFAALGLAIPTEADQYLNIPIFGSTTGYIAYNFATQRWEVTDIRQSHKMALMNPPELDGRTIHFPFELIGVNDCDNTGVVDVTFTTATTSVVRELSKAAGGPIEWENVDIEVWDVGAPTSDSIATVLRRGLYAVFKDDCRVYWLEREFEVFASSDDPTEWLAWNYDQEVAMLYNIYVYGNQIWGDFLNITVPCTGLEFSLPLIDGTYCDSSGGSG